MIDHFEDVSTLDMIFHSVKFCVIKCREVLSFFNKLRETSWTGADFGQFIKVFWKLCELLLVFTKQVSLNFCVGRRNLICCRHLWWQYHGFQVIKRYGLLQVGSDFVDRAADFGRRRVSDLVMDVRMRFVSNCSL